MMIFSAPVHWEVTEESMWLVAAVLVSQKEWKSSIHTTKQSTLLLLNFLTSKAISEACRQQPFFLLTMETN